MKQILKALMSACIFISTSSIAADFPSSTVRFIVPYPAGGTTDMLARAISAKLQEKWGHSVVVLNKPGGNAIIATGALATSEPDGHTIGMVLTSHVVNPYVNKDLPYDSVKDFTPITMVAKVPGLMVASKESGFTNLDDVIKAAKEKPGKLNYGSPGTLTSGHLSMEILNNMAGIEVTHVPYKGGAPALMAVRSNEVQFVIGGPPNLMSNVTAGNLHAIGVTTKERSESMPNVPTIAEQGLPEFDTYEWYGILAPAGISDEVARELNSSITEVLGLPDIQTKFKAQGAIIVANDNDEFGDFIKAELESWQGLVKRIGFKAE